MIIESRQLTFFVCNQCVSPLFTDSTSQKNLIITDLIGEKVKPFAGTDVISIPDLTLGLLVNSIRFHQGGFNIPARQRLIFHVGTNDVPGGHMAVNQMLFLYQTVIKEIRKQSADVQIFISSLIHRELDYQATKAFVLSVNVRLVELAKKVKVSFIPCFKSFLFKRQPVRDFYGTDRLRLSDKGTARLVKLYRHALSPKNADRLKIM